MCVCVFWGGGGEEESTKKKSHLFFCALLLPPPPPPPHTHTHQVYRLQAQVDLALADLDTAIQLSGVCGRAAEQAYTQRGLVWRLRGEDERALEDFKSAARLGSHFAQKQVILCYLVTELTIYSGVVFATTNWYV